MAKAYFIVGTDTGVGKTLMTTALLVNAQQQGHKAIGLKPIAAGAELIDGEWQNSDGQSLMAHSPDIEDYKTINPMALPMATSPHIALADAGQTIHLQQLVSHCQQVMRDCDYCFIEGAGGWQVPISEQYDMPDLVKALSIPVIVIVGMRIGCINHALLTIEAIQSSGIKLAGWIANYVIPDFPGYDEYFLTLQKRIEAPCLGKVPFLSTTPYDGKDSVIPRLDTAVPAQAAGIHNALRALARRARLDSGFRRNDEGLVTVSPMVIAEYLQLPA